MAKRSKRRAVLRDKDQAGCMWGFISIFDFRHGRLTRKLLPVRRNETRNTVGASSATAKLKMLKYSDVMCQSSGNGGESEKSPSDVVKTCVKELMEEEMFSEQGLKKQMNNLEVDLFDLEYGGHVKKNHKGRNKTSKKPCDIHGNSNLQVSAQKTSNYLDLEGIMEELSGIRQRNDWHDGFDMQSNKTYSVVEEKLIAAIEVLMNQKFTNGEILTENGKIHRSKEFIDALNILSSNKELFLKLLQDPNSHLVKPIQGSEHVAMARLNLLEDETSNSRTEKCVARKNRNFFRRSKSQESSPLEGNDKSQLPSRIVILKPGHANDKMKNEVQSERNASQFSFMEIKRKLKHAMGKKRYGISPHMFAYKPQNFGDSEKGVVEGTSGWSSPNRNHFYTERFAKSRDSERKIMGSETSGDPKQRVSSMYIEAKKHLSEMLSSGDENAELMIGKLPKTLGRMLSLPEYNFSPSGSPRKEFVTAQMRLSPLGNFQIVNESQPCVIDDNPDEKVPSSSSYPEFSYELNRDKLEGETPSFTREEISSEGVVEIVKTTDIESQEDGKILNVSCESCSSLNNIDVLDNDTDEVRDEERSPQCLKLDSLDEDQLPSSPTVSSLFSSLASKTEELESAIDKTGRPSPISVLEPVFSEDDISPASTTIARPVETAIQPLHIHFEEIVSPATDREIYIRTCVENEESAFEYVEAVLLASDLNWDEFLMRWLSSDQPLDPSLFDEVELFSNRSCHDQRFLFDCTNEILKEVCDCYFGFFPGVSFVKQNTRTLPKAMNLIQEVWGGIELLLQNPYPRSLDQLVKKDLGKSGTWKDLRLETEHIVIEMEESILEVLIDDTFLSFVNDFAE